MNIDKSKVRFIEAGHCAQIPLVMSCKFCGRRLFFMEAGDHYTTVEKGPCTCSWHCCAASSFEEHPDHIIYTPSTNPDLDRRTLQTYEKATVGGDLYWYMRAVAHPEEHSSAYIIERIAKQYAEGG